MPAADPLLFLPVLGTFEKNASPPPMRLGSGEVWGVRRRRLAALVDREAGGVGLGRLAVDLDPEAAAELVVLRAARRVAQYEVGTDVVQDQGVGVVLAIGGRRAALGEPGERASRELRRVAAVARLERCRGERVVLRARAARAARLGAAHVIERVLDGRRARPDRAGDGRGAADLERVALARLETRGHGNRLAVAGRQVDDLQPRLGRVGPGAGLRQRARARVGGGGRAERRQQGAAITTRLAAQRRTPTQRPARRRTVEWATCDEFRRAGPSE